MTIKYTDEQIANLLKEVEVSFAQSLKKSEEAPEAKEDEGSDEDKKEDADEAKDEPAESKEDEGSDEDKKEDAAEAKDESKDESKDQDFDYDDEDMDELHKMYASMGEKEKAAHHGALKKALGLEDKTEQPVAPDMQKSEEASLAKAEITSLQAKNAELQKSLDAVTKFLDTLNKSVPQRKSITSVDYIQKSEESKEVSSEQVDVILQKKVRDSSLSKSDRDAINTYYLNGKSIETIKHLLK